MNLITIRYKLFISKASVTEQAKNIDGNTISCRILIESIVLIRVYHGRSRTRFTLLDVAYVSLQTFFNKDEYANDFSLKMGI